LDDDLLFISEQCTEFVGFDFSAYMRKNSKTMDQKEKSDNKHHGDFSNTFH